MRDLFEVLREKELTIKRLEKEIEAIRVVMAILEEDNGRTAVRSEPKIPAYPAPGERPHAAPLPNTNNIPALPNVPFGVSQSPEPPDFTRTGPPTRTRA